MNNIHIDTNIILRFLIRDNIDQFEKILEKFNAAERVGNKMVLSSVIFAEIIYVLESFYNFSKDDLLRAIDIITNLDVIAFEEPDVIAYLIKLYFDANLSFPDCYLAAKCLVNKEELFTFDKRLKNIIRKFQS